MRKGTWRLWVLLAIMALALAGCGGGDTSGTTTRAGSGGGDPHGADDVLEHVHGIGVDPGDGAIMLATHTGLFRLPAGADRPVRVGDLRHDIMGFTVVGAGRYLGSGHPDLRSDLPPLLGLVSSRDGGRTWEPVSLLGEADFHILRVRGDRVMGMDSASGDVFTSGDGGREWRRTPPPGPLVDMVMHPGGGAGVVASTGDGILGSRDGGATWRPLSDGPGHLAWPGARSLYRVGGDGTVSVSTDGGSRWSERGRIAGTPAAFAADGAGRLLVATHEGRLMESRDGGMTWGVRAVLV